MSRVSGDRHEDKQQSISALASDQGHNHLLRTNSAMGSMCVSEISAVMTEAGSILPQAPSAEMIGIRQRRAASIKCICGYKKA